MAMQHVKTEQQRQSSPLQKLKDEAEFLKQAVAGAASIEARLERVENIILALLGQEALHK